MDVPRYKASMPMQKVFITNADGCGDHIFTQIKRQGNVAIYSRTNCSTKQIVGYEVIVIKTVKAGTIYAKGGKPTKVATESYPGAQSFGRLAKACVSLDQANRLFAEMVKNQVVEEAVKIPEGEFNVIQFSTANCMPVGNESVELLQNLLRSGKVKLSRVEEKVPGRKIQWFVVV
jgi:hypothetical protein